MWVVLNLLNQKLKHFGLRRSGSIKYKTVEPHCVLFPKHLKLKNYWVLFSGVKEKKKMLACFGICLKNIWFPVVSAVIWPRSVLIVNQDWIWLDLCLKWTATDLDLINPPDEPDHSELHVLPRTLMYLTYNLTEFQSILRPAIMTKHHSVPSHLPPFQ